MPRVGICNRTETANSTIVRPGYIYTILTFQKFVTLKIVGQILFQV